MKIIQHFVRFFTRFETMKCVPGTIGTLRTGVVGWWCARYYAARCCFARARRRGFPPPCSAGPCGSGRGSSRSCSRSPRMRGPGGCSPQRTHKNNPDRGFLSFFSETQCFFPGSDFLTPSSVFCECDFNFCFGFSRVKIRIFILELPKKFRLRRDTIWVLKI